MAGNRLSTLHDLIAAGVLLRVACDKCRRHDIRDPASLLAALGDAPGDATMRAVARRMRCRACGHRGAALSVAPRERNYGRGPL